MTASVEDLDLQVEKLLAATGLIIGVSGNHNQILKLLVDALKEQDAQIAGLKQAHSNLAQRLDNKTAELGRRIDKTEGIHGSR